MLCLAPFSALKVTYAGFPPLGAITSRQLRCFSLTACRLFTVSVLALSPKTKITKRLRKCVRSPAGGSLSRALRVWLLSSRPIGITDCLRHSLVAEYFQAWLAPRLALPQLHHQNDTVVCYHRRTDSQGALMLVWWCVAPSCVQVCVSVIIPWPYFTLWRAEGGGKEQLSVIGEELPSLHKFQIKK